MQRGQTIIDGILIGDSIFVNVSRLNFGLIMMVVLGLCGVFMISVLLITFCQTGITFPSSGTSVQTVAIHRRNVSQENVPVVNSPLAIGPAIVRDFSAGLQNENFNPNIELLQNPLSRIRDIATRENINITEGSFGHMAIGNVSEHLRRQGSFNPLVHENQLNESIDSFTDSDDSLEGYDNAARLRQARAIRAEQTREGQIRRAHLGWERSLPGSSLPVFGTSNSSSNVTGPLGVFPQSTNGMANRATIIGNSVIVESGGRTFWGTLPSRGRGRGAALRRLSMQDNVFRAVSVPSSTTMDFPPRQSTMAAPSESVAEPIYETVQDVTYENLEANQNDNVYENADADNDENEYPQGMRM